MILVYSDERSRYEAVCSYFERNIPKEERFRWDPAVKRWFTRDPSVARRLARYAQGSAAMRLTGLGDAEKAALAASQAEDSNLTIPVPPGLDYLPYQRAGIAYALQRTNALIADEMGLGKTIQAIGVVNALFGNAAPAGSTGNRGVAGSLGYSNPCRVLIVCPASLRLNWRAEWVRWHTGPLRPYLLDTWPGGMFDDTAGKVLIVSYDSVQKWHPMIAETPFDVLILDEAHLVKDEGARRTKSIFGGKYKGKTFEPIQAARKLFLSGTPIVNKPAELWPLVKALAPEGLGSSRVDFIERYTGHDRLDELHLRLRTQIMVRRLKADVLKQLPAKRRQIVLLDVEHADDILAAEGRAISLAQAMLERTRAEIADLPHAEQVMRLRQCRSVAMTEIARVRKETALAKLPKAIEHIHDILENVSKVVVFSHHHDVGDALAHEFRRTCVVLDGRTVLSERQHAVDRFQQDRGVRLFIGSIRAAGLGITLTAASVVVFVELDWTPAAMMQSEDRLHRIGQVNPVLVQHLVIDGSLDSKMAKILIGKQAMMDAALDGGPPELRERDILQEVLRA